jgi:hypothetical protein
VGNVLFASIGLDNTTGYHLDLEGDKIYKYKNARVSSLSLGIDHVEPGIGAAFRFLFFLLKNERSE